MQSNLITSAGCATQAVLPQETSMSTSGECIPVKCKLSPLHSIVFQLRLMNNRQTVLLTRAKVLPCDSSDLSELRSLSNWCQTDVYFAKRQAFRAAHICWSTVHGLPIWIPCWHLVIFHHSHFLFSDITVPTARCLSSGDLPAATTQQNVKNNISVWRRMKSVRVNILSDKSRPVCCNNTAKYAQHLFASYLVW